MGWLTDLADRLGRARQEHRDRLARERAERLTEAERDARVTMRAARIVTAAADDRLGRLVEAYRKAEEQDR